MSAYRTTRNTGLSKIKIKTATYTKKLPQIYQSNIKKIKKLSQFLITNSFSHFESQKHLLQNAHQW